MRQSKNAIALLITVVFVMLITIAIGFGLRQVNQASELIKEEKFLYQSSIIVEDILNILQNSPDVARAADANASDEFFMLLSEGSFIPFESAGISIVLKLHSARSKFNLATLNVKSTEAFREYMSYKGLNNEYVDILLDGMSGIKADNSYNSAVFDEQPYLFRDYIASEKHLSMLNEFYMREYNENVHKNVNLEELLYFNEDVNATIDLNYATSEVWELLLGSTKERAEFLAQNAGGYKDLASLGLGADELENLQRFNTSFFEPILFVEIEIAQENSDAYITFEYDIKKKKGSNFVYEI